MSMQPLRELYRHGGWGCQDRGEKIFERLDGWLVVESPLRDWMAGWLIVNTLKDSMADWLLQVLVIR